MYLQVCDPRFPIRGRLVGGHFEKNDQKLHEN